MNIFGLVAFLSVICFVRAAFVDMNHLIKTFDIVADKSNQNDLGLKIVGGQDASINDYPYQVSLRKPSTNNSHFCGGSIINRRCILTAAHCLESKKPSDFNVHVGTALLNETGQVRKVKSLHYHEDFDMFYLQNDIGVIILEEDLEFGKSVQSLKLCRKNITAGTPAILSGWGKTEVGGPLPNTLQQINMTTIGEPECKSYQWRISESHICTLSDVGKGACNGDSGSALITLSKEQIGIVSFGTLCAKGKPDVYTRISTFYDWIDKRCSAIAN